MDVDDALQVLIEADPVRQLGGTAPVGLGRKVLAGDVGLAAAGGRKRVLRTRLLVTMSVVSVVATVVGLTIASQPLRTDRLPSTSHRSHPPAGDSGGRGAVHIGLAQLFAATSADFYGRNGNTALLDFLNEVRLTQANRCITAAGYTSPSDRYVIPRRPEVPVDNLQYPDLALYAHGTFGPLVASNGSSGPAGTAGLIAGSCLERAERQQSNALGTPWAMLNERWSSALAAVSDSRRTTEAWSKWATCVEAKGVPVSTPTAFFGLADEAVGLPGYQHGPSEVARLAHIYGQCVGGVERSLNRQRQEAVARLVRADRGEIGQAEATLDRYVATESRLDHLPYPPSAS